jgi:enamine deaminase RidA (YjgF/YER057c/UK114 family)
MTVPKQRVRSFEVPEPAPGLWSNCMRVGDAIYVSGMVSTGADGVIGIHDEYVQARTAFEKIRSLLASAGASMDDIVKLTIFVTRMANSAGVRRARSEFFTGDFPASSMVEVSRLGRPELLVEIEAVAYAGAATARTDKA